MSMKTMQYKVSFTTPAFLGNAEQQAQWRGIHAQESESIGA